jgi:hypothetical protein
VTDEAALGEGRVERHEFLGQKGTEGMFLVTVYKMKDSVGIGDMRALTEATKMLRQDTRMAPAPGTLSHYVTKGGGNGVIIVETDQPDSAWVNQVKQTLATWLEFGETQRMEVFKLANFNFGAGTGPRERGQVPR